MLIDRRGMHLQSKEGLDEAVVDRYKYDRDDDDDDEVPTYLIDPYDISSMRYRAAIAGSAQPHQQGARRAQIEASGSSSAAGSSSQGSTRPQTGSAVA